jgi:tetratricopeptide (TPR) repeat protein
MQADPDLIAYSRLYIWFLLQEQNFPAALRQSIALDKRVGNEDPSIMNLAFIASNNHDYDVAREGYEYLMGKGQNSPLYYQCYILNLQMMYRKYEEEGFSNLQDGQVLAEKFRGAFEFMKYSPASYPLVKYFAHLLAFSLHQPEEAIAELKKGTEIRGISLIEIGELKTEMADIYVYAGDPWEATLIYSQVIEENKDNALGDAAKLKKAKLSYYLGSFSWAQAQLDVIKASTSKLTSNDAFELSLLISSNLDLDTTSLPLEMFARADFYFFRNQDSLALTVLDSIEAQFPYNTLVDDILFRRATIQINNGRYDEAVADLQKVVSDFSFESLADDAMFLLGDVYQNYLKNKEKAMETYTQLMVSFPGSIYVVDARKRYRELRGDKPTDDLPNPDRETQMFNGL